MRKCFYILITVAFINTPGFAQNSAKNFPILDLKSWSRSETMVLNNELGGGLTPEQTSYIYSSNLHAIIKINEMTHGNITEGNWDKNKKRFDAIINEREITYKKVLSSSQYQKHIEAEKKRNGNYANTSIQVSAANSDADSVSSVSSYPAN